MKKILLLLSFIWAGYSTVWAQIPNGSTAPNFTVVDINGQSHNLYNLLDQGKTVYLDFFATWCAPCWNYHQTHALADIWDEYGPPGTGEAYVISIESDPSTNVACITALPSCVGGTQGNWAAGTPYPIADAATVAGNYQISYYPTIMMVCPADRKVYEVGQQSAGGLWAARSTTCPPLAVVTAIESVQNTTCYNSNTGDIDISIESGGTAPYTYNWSNGAHTQDLVNVPVGTYTCTVTCSQGWTGTTGPITVEGPPEPLTMQVVESLPVGCNGITGSVTVAGGGGWPGEYTYNWNNGQTGPEAYNLTSGNYTVSIIDENGCTTPFPVTVAPVSLPTASITPPGIITCTTPTQELNVTVSGGLGDYNYQWNASAGGNIVSGGETPNPIVSAAGNYSVQITDTYTSCTAFALTPVAANISAPTANAGPAQSVTCSSPSTTLQGSGSSGANFIYLWTASNGGNVTGGANTLTPTVNASGTYTLVVTNANNGCTQGSATTVTGNNVPPSTSASGGALTCVTNAVGLTASTNATTPSFIWTGPNGYTSTEQNPTVGVVGDYLLTVSDAATGCSNTASAVVANNTQAPGAGATGGTLTCAATSVTLSGSSNVSGTSFSWTGPNGYVSAEQNPVVSLTGDYNLLVTNTANGCTSTAMTAVGENTTPPTAGATTPGNLNCQNLQIQIDGSGSSQGANMVYLWSTTTGHIVSGENTLMPLVDVAGTYNLLVTNSDNGCTSTTAAQVAQSAVVTAAINSPTNVACNGGATGSAMAIPGGGNANYSYIWSNGASAATATGLAAGTYQVTVTDGENCTASAAVSITEPSVLVVNASATAQTAANTNDGTATASPAGGTSGYTYAWSNGETTQTITGLAPAAYTVTITDINGCAAVQTVTVNAFNCTLLATPATTNVTCFGAGNGTASLSLEGANEPITFEWSNGANTPSVQNLTPGAYTVEVTDVTNCALLFNLTISEPTVLNANASATPVSGAGATDGTATAAPTGGTAGYTYIWNNGETTQTIVNLAPDTYVVTVTDANGCTSVQSVVVNAFNCLIEATTAVGNIACAGDNSGSISLNISGGTEPLTFAWNNGGNTASLVGLAPGTYTASITDANGCQTVAGATITEPEALETESNSANPACPDNLTGTAEVIAAGGLTPYAYNWSNGATTNSISGLAPGTYTVTLTDANNCTAVSIFLLTATDNIAPAITAQNTTLALGASGTVAVSLQNLGASVSDNCTVADVVITPGAFNCDELGEQEVTLTATDAAGNTASATVLVMVVDDIAPTVTCPQAITHCWYANTVTYDAPVAVDNCLGETGEWKLVEGLPSGSEFPTGVTNQTYTYTDASGNAGTCSFAITITTPMNLAVASVTNDINNQGLGAIDINIGGGTAPYKFVWTNSFGLVVGDTEDLTGIPAGSYTVQIRDDNDCLIALESIVVSNTTATSEPSWLQGVMLRPNPTKGYTQVVFTNALSEQMEVSVIDATGRVVLNQIVDHPTVVKLDCSGLPEGIYQVRFRTGQETGVRKLAVNR